MIFQTFFFIYLTQFLTPATRRRDHKKFIFSEITRHFSLLESRPSTMKFLVFLLARFPSLKNRVKSEQREGEGRKVEITSFYIIAS